jgi:hypothetical protein
MLIAKEVKRTGACMVLVIRILRRATMLPAHIFAYRKRSRRQGRAPILWSLVLSCPLGHLSRAAAVVWKSFMTILELLKLGEVPIRMGPCVLNSLRSGQKQDSDRSKAPANHVIHVSCRSFPSLSP